MIYAVSTRPPERNPTRDTKEQSDQAGMSSAANFIARRSNSSTSLAQFYKENNNNINPSLSNHNGELDFCNAFWGEGDAGYEVISARLRASNRTVDDLRAFWKERYESSSFSHHEHSLIHDLKCQSCDRRGLCEETSKAREIDSG